MNLPDAALASGFFYARSVKFLEFPKKVCQIFGNVNIIALLCGMKKAIEIYSATTGNIKKRCNAVCLHYGLFLGKLKDRRKAGTTDGKTIWLKSLVDEFDLFVFWHEFAHTQMHHGFISEIEYNRNKPKYETEADNFAAEVMRELGYAESVIRAATI